MEGRWKEKIIVKIAYAMPRCVAYWCFIRVVTWASHIREGKYPGDITALEAATAWDILGLKPTAPSKPAEQGHESETESPRSLT